MSSSTNPEKLVYLQNGVFKRKELSDGLQYYANNAFNTFALPAANGNYVLTNTNNVFTWTDAGDVSTGGEEGEITGTLDNSHFQTSDGNALTIAANGTIPYFKNNSQFAGLDFPTSGTHVLVTNGDTSAPTWTQLSEEIVLNNGGYNNTSNKYLLTNWNSTTSNHRTLALPDTSGYYMLCYKPLSEGDISTADNFMEITANALFTNVLGINSTQKSVIAYSGNSAHGLSLPAESGYAALYNFTGTAMPVFHILDAEAVFKTIYGCTTSEYCLMYNNGNTVNKLSIPTDANKYMIERTSGGEVLLSAPDEKLTFTFEQLQSNSGTQIIASDTITPTGAPRLESGKKYLITLDITVICYDYEQALVGFTTEPTYTIGFDNEAIIRANIGNAQRYTHLSGSAIVSLSSGTSFALTCSYSGDSTITYYRGRYKVNIVEL